MKKEKPWAPPAGSWEDDVDHVETVEQRVNPKTGAQEKFGYLMWKHRSEEGHQIKTQHPLQLIFKKCPQRVCLTLSRYCYKRLLALDACILRGALGVQQRRRRRGTQRQRQHDRDRTGRFVSIQEICKRQRVSPSRWRLTEEAHWQSFRSSFCQLLNCEFLPGCWLTNQLPMAR